jgi:AbrB family looped-hinge helix DNA binding protein
MGSLATTRLSSKGQVVIPEEIRLRLGLKEGTQFVGDRDVVIVKSIPPSDGGVRRARAPRPRGGTQIGIEEGGRAPRDREGPSLQVRIVLDTNVLVSGVFFGGPPGRILEAWRDRRIQLVLSPEILGEYQRVGQGGS